MTTGALPLRPIETDIAATLQTTVSQRELTREIAAEAVRRQFDTVMFVGVGGSWASSVPAVTLLTAKARKFSVYNINSGEFPHIYQGRVDSRTLVVASSHSGGTPETVAAAQAAAAEGALVVSVATDADNPLGAAAKFQLTYGSEHTATSAKYELLEELSYSLLEATGVELDYAGVRAALSAIPEAAVAATEAMETTTGTAVAKLFPAEDIFVLGSGRLFGLAYMLSVCYLVEMQWRPSTHFNSADFFHGPFELIGDSTSVIHLAGEDEAKPLGDRVEKFLDKYGRNHYTISSGALQLPGIAAEHRSSVAHIAMASVVSRVAYHFEPLSGHDLDTRRYMHKVEY